MIRLAQRAIWHACFDICIVRNSVVKRLKYDGIFNDRYIVNFPLSVPEKEYSNYRSIKL